MEAAGDMPTQAAQSGVSPELSVRRGREAIEFYKNPFGHQWEIGKPVVEWPPSDTNREGA